MKQRELGGVALAAVLGGLVLLAGCNAAGNGGGGGSGNGGGAPNGQNGDNGSDGNGGGDNGGNGDNPTEPISADGSASTTSVAVESGSVGLVSLDASRSASVFGDIVSYEWIDASCGELATGMLAEVMLPIGQHDLTLRITDTAGTQAQSRLTITVSDNRPETFSVTTAVSGNGETIPAMGSNAGFAAGSTATITALADVGSQFVRWEGDSNAETATIQVVMDDNKSLTAVFEPIPEGGLPRFHLPWSAGETRTIGQANGGTFSHTDRFAWDVNTDIGTPIVSVAAGRVIDVRDDLPNNTDGVVGDAEAPANIVMIDHGGGFLSLYAHLDQFGAVVMPGQRVARGQMLGRSGNSGYSTGPHLHYEILNTFSESASSGFVESLATNGIAQEGDVITSQNVYDSSTLDSYVESVLPIDAFALNNVELEDTGVPAAFFTAGETYTFRGRVLDDATDVCVALVDPESGATLVCDIEQVEADKTFEADLVIPDDVLGNLAMGVVTGMAGVSGGVPVSILVSAVPVPNTVPTATVETPADNAIAYDETVELRGSVADGDGDPLMTEWMQVSGPRAVIADPSSLETTFTVIPGAGSTYVRFQLIAFDGVEFSEPAEVEFSMQDDFAVRVIGVTDEECVDLAGCTAVTKTELSAARDRVQIWVELLNINEGDVASFSVRDPTGETVLSGRLCEPTSGSFVESFWRFGWSGAGLEPISGQWEAAYIRNGIEEIVTPFTVGP